MRQEPSRNAWGPETGGITILVVFMILVLLTISAMSMSKNALREVVSSGVSRQGAMAANGADSGIEWSLYWFDTENAAKGTDSALDFRTLKVNLLQDSTLAGKPYYYSGGLKAYDVKAPPDPPADLVVSNANGISQGFTIALTRMGKLPITDISQGIGTSGFTPAQGGESKAAPDLWAVRSDSQVKVGTGALATTFYHSKEGWLSTPVSN